MFLFPTRLGIHAFYHTRVGFRLLTFVFHLLFVAQSANKCPFRFSYYVNWQYAYKINDDYPSFILISCNFFFIPKKCMHLIK